MTSKPLSKPAIISIAAGSIILALLIAFGIALLISPNMRAQLGLEKKQDNTEYVDVWNSGITGNEQPYCVDYVPEQDPELLTRLKALGATRFDNLSLRYGIIEEDGYTADRVNGYTVLDEVAPSDDDVLLYCNYGELYTRIQIKQNANDNTLAHEYLHYAWGNLMSNGDKSLARSLSMDIYGRDDSLRNHLENGSGLSNVFEGVEQFAYYCTRYTDQYIGYDLVAVCNKYIDRSKLVFDAY
jgi:hypothetical protein